MAETHAILGELIAEYRFDRTRPIFLLILFLALAAFIAFVLFQPSTWSNAYTPYGLAVGSSLIVGMLFAMARRNLNGIGKRIDLYENGLQITEKQRVHVVLWEDITTINRNAASAFGDERSVFDAYDIWQERRGIANITSDSINDLTLRQGQRHDLIQFLFEKTTPHLLRRYKTELENGQSISFGNLQFDSKNIHDDEMLIPWSTIAKCEVTNTSPHTEFVLKNLDGEVVYTLTDFRRIPNQHVLQPLLEENVLRQL